MNALQHSVEQFLYRKAALCDAQDWDAYLDLFDEDSEFHVPQWDAEHEYTTDPKRGMSLIYYSNRTGLEDRVFRIKTERSSATMPDTRTSHNISNVELERQEGSLVTVRFNWHTLSHRYKTNYSHFGMARYVIDFGGERPQIRNKYVVLKNDYIHQVIDVYHI
jgi:benzoate/toluate 1,2-dioxygenase beta subunit